MPRFFTNEIDENNIVLTGSDANHIGRSLRMRNGEAVTVCCNGIDYCCTIGSITSDMVYLNLLEKHRCAAEPNVEVTLFQAVPKLDKLEYIIQKSVELGVSRIVPVLTRRCVSRPDEKEFEKKKRFQNNTEHQKILIVTNLFFSYVKPYSSAQNIQ